MAEVEVEGDPEELETGDGGQADHTNMDTGSWGRCKVMSRVRGKITRLNKLLNFGGRKAKGLLEVTSKWDIILNSKTPERLILQSGLDQA